MTNHGKKSMNPPCGVPGHTGTHVVGNFILCDQGCDSEGKDEEVTQDFALITCPRCKSIDVQQFDMNGWLGYDPAKQYYACSPCGCVF